MRAGNVVILPQRVVASALAVDAHASGFRRAIGTFDALHARAQVRLSRRHGARRRAPGKVDRGAEPRCERCGVSITGTTLYAKIVDDWRSTVWRGR